MRVGYAMAHFPAPDAFVYVQAPAGVSPRDDRSCAFPEFEGSSRSECLRLISR